MRKVMLENGVEAWSFSSSQYVQAAIKTVEEFLQKEEGQNSNHNNLPTQAGCESGTVSC